MTRILLSMFTIGVVMALATTATLAFFTDTQTIAGNTITTAGNLDFDVVMTDTAGAVVPNFVENGLSPGESATRCLWIRNAGEVPGRYKFYRVNPDSGSGALGNALRLDSTLNPSTGNCSGLSRPASFTDPLVYGPADLAKTEWQNVALRSGNFDSASTTPYLIREEEPAMEAGYYSVFAIKVTLPSTATSEVANTSYTTGLELFGMQKEGSDVTVPPSGWNTSSL
ncbi:MAG: SipW-dependent-type signal peptide-containing protein [bacterium]|nr:SipW-dependent-type signal peptide-containing protein [bacterium]